MPNDKDVGKVAWIGLLLGLMLSFPLISIVNRGVVWRRWPVLFLYIFAIWALVIFAMFWHSKKMQRP